ncbi:MAG: ABC transporter ATP-binding protein [Pseudomonadota bacterium]
MPDTLPPDKGPTAQVENAGRDTAQGAVSYAAMLLEGVKLTLGAAAGPVEILKGVDFRVERGERVAVVGPSGSGKSSLIAVAAGLEPVSAGTVTLLGERIDGMGEDALARLRRGRVSLVFQSFHLLETMTAFDNVRVPLEIARIADVDARAREAMDAVGLGHRLTHYPGQMSGGERQRVAVARALASDPALVFADEPTGNLDAETGAGVADLLFDIAGDRGASLVLVTHDLALAKRADRVVTMQAGRLA